MFTMALNDGGCMLTANTYMRPAKLLLAHALVWGFLSQDCYNFVVTALEPVMDLLQCNYITQLTKLLTGLLMPADGTSRPSGVHVQRIYVFALMWSLGGTLELPDRQRMQAFLAKHDHPLQLPPTPEGSSIFECVPLQL